MLPSRFRNCLSWAGFIALTVSGSSARANPYVDHYAYDVDFNGGVVLDDRFAMGQESSHYAERLTLLPNGDAVVAGLVPTASQYGNLVGGNIGLVHYTSDGGRTGWANPPGAYASYFNIYITFPNSDTAKWAHIADLKYFNGYLYMLADYRTSSGNGDVFIVVFGTDGSYVGTYAAFTTGLFEFGAALVPYSDGQTSKIIAVATYDSGDVVQQNNTVIPHWVVTMKRFSVGAGGTLSVDTAFGHINNGAIDQPLPVDLCDPGTVNACSGIAMSAAGARTDTLAPTAYVLGSVAISTPLMQNSKTDAFVMAVDGTSGDLVTAFGTAGIYDQPLQIGDPAIGFTNEFGPAKRIFATAGADFNGDVVYFVTEDNAFTSCSFYGAAIYKVRANAGPPFNTTLPDFAWGLGGKATVAPAPNCSPSGPNRNSTPSSMAHDGSRILVGGVNNDGDPVLGAVRLSDGKLADFKILPWLRSDGSEWVGNRTPGGYLDAGYHDLANAGNGLWTATGTICDATTTTACTLFGTTRLKSDEIFGNGFD